VPRCLGAGNAYSIRVCFATVKSLPQELQLIGQKGFTVTFTTAASLVSQQLEARDERRLLKLQRDLASVCEEWEASSVKRDTGFDGWEPKVGGCHYNVDNW
jgi:hypothetical protein